MVVNVHGPETRSGEKLLHKGQRLPNKYRTSDGRGELRAFIGDHLLHGRRLKHRVEQEPDQENFLDREEILALPYDRKIDVIPRKLAEIILGRSTDCREKEELRNELNVPNKDRTPHRGC